MKYSCPVCGKKLVRIKWPNKTDGFRCPNVSKTWHNKRMFVLMDDKAREEKRQAR